jgi:H+/Cl- antiporter ClcA
MFFNEEIGSIRAIISSHAGEGGIKVEPAYLMTYAAVWYVMWILTYGVWVPAGLFLPGIIVGSAVGSVYETVREEFYLN